MYTARTLLKTLAPQLLQVAGVLVVGATIIGWPALRRVVQRSRSSG